MKKIIKLTTQEVIDKINDYINNCDGDELARLLGECFGGECYENDKNNDTYDFKPNENFIGFDN